MLDKYPGHPILTFVQNDFVENGLIAFSFQTEGGKTKLTGVLMSYSEKAE